MSDEDCLLSVVIIGRDDGYMPDFRYRLQTTLDHFSNNIAKLGQSMAVEIVFVDWGSDPALSETLPVAPETRKLVRWLNVPASTIQELLGAGDRFHNTLAFNAGLRRTRGRFVAFFPADALLPIHALAQLIELLAGRISCPVKVEEALLFIARGHVPWQFVGSAPTIDQWDRYLWMNAWSIPIAKETNPSLFGGAAAFVLSRSLWHACGGLDESLGGWGGSDTDLGFRIGTLYPWLDLTFLGIRAYHMEHGPGGSRGEAVKKANPLLFDRPFRANDDNWGLASARLPLIQRPVQSTTLFPQGHLPLDGVIGSSTAGYSASWPELNNVTTEHAAAKAIQQTIKHVGKHLDRLPCRLHEVEALLAAACRSAARPIRSCIDFGVRSPLTLAVIATLSPAATIQGVAASPAPVVCQVSVLLHLVLRHTGYLRFVYGDPSTAIPRAVSSSPSGNTCDLVMVPCDLDTAVFTTVMKQAFATLEPDGCCLVSANSNELFQSRWEDAKCSLPDGQFVLVGKSGCCGLVWKKEFAAGSLLQKAPSTIHFTPHIIKQLHRTINRLHRRRKFRRWTKKLTRPLEAFVKAWATPND